MRIPTFEEAEYLVKNGEATPLDQFVYEHEPAGELEEQEFRDDLLDLIEFVLQSVNSKEQEREIFLAQISFNNKIIYCLPVSDPQIQKILALQASQIYTFGKSSYSVKYYSCKEAMPSV